MTIHIVDRAPFNAWAAKHRDVLRDNDWIAFDPDPEVYDDAFDALLSYASSCTELFDGMMRENGLRVLPHGIMFDDEKLSVIENVAALVASDYERENGRNTEMPDSPWVLYGLGGDDSVDYCGSYIDTAIMLLRLFTGLPHADGYPHIPHV